MEQSTRSLLLVLSLLRSSVFVSKRGVSPPCAAGDDGGREQRWRAVGMLRQPHGSAGAQPADRAQATVRAHTCCGARYSCESVGTVCRKSVSLN
eukprot:6208699-Pleurochrysis_carterae.AAC.3